MRLASDVLQMHFRSGQSAAKNTREMGCFVAIVDLDVGSKLTLNDPRVKVQGQGQSCTKKRQS